MRRVFDHRLLLGSTILTNNRKNNETLRLVTKFTCGIEKEVVKRIKAENNVFELIDDYFFLNEPYINIDFQ